MGHARGTVDGLLLCLVMAIARKWIRLLLCRVALHKLELSFVQVVTDESRKANERKSWREESKRDDLAHADVQMASLQTT